MKTYHRHVKKWLTLQETVQQMAELGDLASSSGPFEFCPICNCVPTTLVGCVEDSECKSANGCSQATTFGKHGSARDMSM